MECLGEGGVGIPGRGSWNTWERELDRGFGRVRTKRKEIYIRVGKKIVLEEVCNGEFCATTCVGRGAAVRLFAKSAIVCSRMRSLSGSMATYIEWVSSTGYFVYMRGWVEYLRVCLEVAKRAVKGGYST